MLIVTASKKYILACLTGLAVLCGHLALAQNKTANSGNTANDWIHDPLKMPDVWKELMKNPIDSSLWVEYYRKNWDKMTMKDLEKLNHWKQQLMLRQLLANEEIIGFVIRPEFRSADFFIDEMAFVEFRDEIKKAKEALKGKNGKKPAVVRAQIAGMEAIILAENDELKRLKANPRANFEMIEQIYAEVFAEFNTEYVFYNQKHPAKRYPLLKWIEDKESELRAMKMKQVEELRKKYQN
ncbi:MAG: hypothetical protein MUC97_07130 [Bernardetiaceae bacterium]|jgi:hypothetical protein|nr:hypothetical protein [Bernardetiaceae bacterium]